MIEAVTRIKCRGVTNIFTLAHSKIWKLCFYLNQTCRLKIVATFPKNWNININVSSSSEQKFEYMRRTLDFPLPNISDNSQLKKFCWSNLVALHNLCFSQKQTKKYFLGANGGFWWCFHIKKPEASTYKKPPLS